MSDDTLTIDKMREAIRSMGEPVPDFIVSIYGLPGIPIEWQGHIFLAPEDAKTLHTKSPLVLRQMLGEGAGRYSVATPFDGPIPVELRVPPFRGALPDRGES